MTFGVKGLGGVHFVNMTFGIKGLEAILATAICSDQLQKTNNAFCINGYFLDEPCPVTTERRL